MREFVALRRDICWLSETLFSPYERVCSTKARHLLALKNIILSHFKEQLTALKDNSSSEDNTGKNYPQVAHCTLCSVRRQRGTKLFVPSELRTIGRKFLRIGEHGLWKISTVLRYFRIILMWRIWFWTKIVEHAFTYFAKG